MTFLESLAEKAARGQLAPPEMQEAVALLLRDLVARQGSGAVSVNQDDVPTRENPARPLFTRRKT